MKIDEIRSETDQFFEWPEEPNGTVTIDSAILFARDCVEKVERQMADVIKARDAAMDMVGSLLSELEQVSDNVARSCVDIAEDTGRMAQNMEKHHFVLGCRAVAGEIKKVFEL